METLGLDLGTNSIGISKRNTDLGSNLFDQLEYFGVTTFNKGVGNSKSGEFSYASERTKHRSSRRLYQSRKYRIWETLKILIEYGYCPLSDEDLDKWRKYDKEKGLKRKYPINAVKFEQWVRLDFDNDGIPEYSSPYQLRAEIASTQYNLDLEINRLKIGRALYHIAQRRGFKSSKGETLKESHENEILDENSLKKSEEKKAKELNEFINQKIGDNISLPTVGCAFYEIERTGQRIRKEYQAVR
jgi:CRISPR-associated endonuclease Csn1